jgi:hypothetical protein
MPQRTEYKVLTGNPQSIQAELIQYGAKGFRPVLMTAVPEATGSYLVVILEHIIGS